MPDRIDFIALQARQRRKTLLLLPIIAAVYFVALSVLLYGVVLALILFLPTLELASVFPFAGVSIATAVVAVITAWTQWREARYRGAARILEALGARRPLETDSYHKRYINLVEEMRIAAGLPAVAAYVIPYPGVTSLAVLGSDGQPKVLASEGMIAELTREQLQGAVAHELAHLLNGDTFFITVLCSLTSIFDRVKELMESKRTDGGEQAEYFNPFIYIAASFGSAMMGLLSTLVSREREVLADATAVQLTRNPTALAGAIYRASLSRRYAGAVPKGYKALYIVAPEAGGLENRSGFWPSLFSTHPPLDERIAALARFAHTSTASLVEAVVRENEGRESARIEVRASGELLLDSSGTISSLDAATPQPPVPQSLVGPTLFEVTGHGPLQGQRLTRAQLVAHPAFNMNLFLRRQGVEGCAPAGEFPEIMAAFRELRRRASETPAQTLLCPHCRSALVEARYEGAVIHQCRGCRGRFVPRTAVTSIMARREFTFSSELARKAEDFRHNIYVNPGAPRAGRIAGIGGGLPCPQCGHVMVSKPFSYTHFVPVDECLTCAAVWFDPDELEVLQVLSEKQERK